MKFSLNTASCVSFVMVGISDPLPALSGSAFACMLPGILEDAPSFVLDSISPQNYGKDCSFNFEIILSS